MFVHYNESCLLLVLQQLFSGIHTVSCFLQAWNCLSLSSSFDICLNISATEVICCLSYNSCFLGPSIWCRLLDTIEPGWGLKFQLLHRGDILKWSYYWQYPLSSKLPSFSNTFMLVSTSLLSGFPLLEWQKNLFSWSHNMVQLVRHSWVRVRIIIDISPIREIFWKMA